MEENNNQVLEKVEGEIVETSGHGQNNDIPEPPAELKARKFASVRFYLRDIIVYRFDLWTTSNGYAPLTDENGNKLIEIKNLINNFDAIRPEKPNQVKDFFAIVGLIRFTFPKTKIPIGKDTKEDSYAVTLENEVMNSIKMAKLKNFKVVIDPESE